MNIISLTDLHGKTPNIAGILRQNDPVDLILLTGDITHFGTKLKAKKILAEFQKTGIPVLAVSGNCDFKGVNTFLNELHVGIHGTHHSTGSVSILGLGGSLPGPAPTPNEYSEEELRQFLDEAYAQIPNDQPLLLVSHQPPFGTLNDSLANGMHVGSHSVRQFIEKVEPLVCFTGHIHEGKGIDFIGKTCIINPGPASQGGYGWVRMDEDGVHAEIRELT